MRLNEMNKALSFCLLLGALSACTAAPKHTDSYSGASGVVPIETDREVCVRSCNADFDRCSDSRPAQERVGRGGQMDGVFGGAADCKDDMKSCLARCKSR